MTESGIPTFRAVSDSAEVSETILGRRLSRRTNIAMSLFGRPDRQLLSLSLAAAALERDSGAHLTFRF
jgi:hypothetical protein